MTHPPRIDPDARAYAVGFADGQKAHLRGIAGPPQANSTGAYAVGYRDGYMAAEAEERTGR